MSKQQVNEKAFKQVLSFDDISVSAPEHRVSPRQFAVWVRALLQGWRQGTVAAKGRSDVSLSGKKPWKQKGTGRARAGDARSPVWRGGGVVFGPQMRVRKISVPKASRKAIFMQILADKIAAGTIVLADWTLGQDQPKTARASELLRSLGMSNKKVAFFVDYNDKVHYSSFLNIPTVRPLFFDQANAYDLVDAEFWLVLKKDLDAFKQMVQQWQ